MAHHREPTSQADRRERDRRWVAALRAGDEQALGEIFRAYYTPLTRYAESIVHSPDVALDVVSDVFHALWTRRAALEPVDLWAYLVSATRNRSLDREERRRLEASTAARFKAAGWTPELGAAPVSPDAELIAHEDARDLRDRIRRAYAELPPRTSEVLDHWAKGESYKEIARSLGISTKTVDAHLQRAKQVLRRLLRGDG